MMLIMTTPLPFKAISSILVSLSEPKKAPLFVTVLVSSPVTVLPRGQLIVYLRGLIKEYLSFLIKLFFLF